MIYQYFPSALLASGAVSAFLGYPVVAAGALVASGLFAIADAVQRKP